MFIFGHTGITTALAHKFKRDIDLRKVALASIANDIIDKPIGLCFRNFFNNHTRLFCHNWFFCSILIFLFIKNKNNKNWENKKIYILAILFHLILDQVWKPPFSHAIFLWPFLGPVPPEPKSALLRWQNALSHLDILIGEMVGFAIYIFYLKKYKLYKKQNLKYFLKTGILK